MTKEIIVFAPKTFTYLKSCFQKIQNFDGATVKLSSSVIVLGVMFDKIHSINK